MKTTFYLNGKKTSRKNIKETVGEDRLRHMLEQAKEVFIEDPYIENSFYLGSSGMLTIEFKL